MDYGGHGSIFIDNLVVTKPGNGNCMGLGPFKEGLGDTYVDNVCVLLGQSGSGGSVGGVSQCSPRFYHAANNQYYLTAHSNATMRCGGKELPLAGLYGQTGVEKNVTIRPMPSDAELIAWGRQRLWTPKPAL